MEPDFSNLFKDVTQEWSLLLLLSLRDPDILKQSKFTDDAINITKYLALENLQRQRLLKDYWTLKDLIFLMDSDVVIFITLRN